MKLTRRAVEKALVLEPEGEIDLQASPELRAEFGRIAEEKPPLLLVDFRRVDYIDSSGLAALIEYHRTASAFKGRMVLFGLQPRVKMVFDLVKLDQLFPIAADEAEALAAG